MSFLAPHQLGWLSRRPARRCSLSEMILSLSSPGPAPGWSGRSSDCEVHLDGNLFFWVAGVAGAGLAFLLNQAITMAGRRRRRREDLQESPLGDLLWLGRVISVRLRSSSPTAGPVPVVTSH